MNNNFFRGAVQSVLVLLGLMLTISAQAASINAMKIMNKDFTRVILSADGALTHQVLLLDNPKRLVLDLKNAPTNETIQMLANHNWNKHLFIKKTRVGTLPEGTRVVFDLSSGVTHKVSTETNTNNTAKGTAHQLILDIFKSY